MKRLFHFLASIAALCVCVSLVAGFVWIADTNSRPAIPEKQLPENKITILLTPNDAVQMALADLASIDPLSRIYIRYIWIQDGSPIAMKVCSLALNYISRGDTIKRPLPIANGHLLRVDLRMYAPQAADTQDWINIWEELSFDPAFSLLVTKDNLDFAAKVAEVFGDKEIIVTPATTRVRKENRVVTHNGGRYVYPDDSGRVHEQLAPGTYTVDLEFDEKVPAVTRHEKGRSGSVDVLRFNPTHVDQQALLRLQTLSVTSAPVVEYRYFLTRALSTIQDKGVFKQVFGGLYYRFRGLKKSTIQGATDLDVFFESLGIGNIKAGLTQEKLFNTLRSDQRLAVFRSDITGKPREVASFHTPADKEGGAWGAITGDIKDERIDIGDRAFANLLTPRRDAREAIFPTRTGFNIFALFNQAGALQDEVPPDVAIDTTIPAPYTRRLQPAISCLRCHYGDGSDGWKPLVNDVKTLLQGRLDILGDISQRRNAFTPQVIDRLAGLYAGDFSKNLRRARDDVAEVTLRATGPFSTSQDQADIAKIAAVALSDSYADYNYVLVDAKKALHELGLEVESTKAVEVFREMMRVDIPKGSIFYTEDPRIASLAEGISILRPDFSLVEHEMFVRLQRNFKRMESHK